MLVFLDLETTGLDPTNDAVLEVAAIITTDDLTEVARFERLVYSRKCDAIIKHCEAVAARFDHWRSEEAAEIIDENERAKRLAEIDEAWSDARSDRSPWRVTGIDVNSYVVKMHWDNGLWKKARRGEAVATVDADLRDFIREHGVVTTETNVGFTTGEHETKRWKTVKPELGGSTISFDRAFLNAHFPLTSAEGKKGVLSHRNVDVSTINEVARRFWLSVYDGRPGRGAKAAHRGMDDIQASIDVLKYYLSTIGPRFIAQYSPEDAINKPLNFGPFNVTCADGLPLTGRPYQDDKTEVP